MNKVLFSSKSNEWETPKYIFDNLNNIHNFTLDPCCTKKTAKCKKYYTKKENGLKQDWQNEIVFMNPPYGREQKYWIEKAFNEWKKGRCKVVGLLPARTDTKYFHDYIYNIKGVSIYFLKGRVKFLLNGKTVNSATFPSMIVIWN